VEVGLVGARHHPPGAPQRLVGQHGHVRSHGTDEPRGGAEAPLDLLLGGRAYRRAKLGGELDLVEPVVSPHEHQQRLAVAHHHGQGLDQGPGGDAELPGHLVDGARAGRLHALGCGQRLRHALDRAGRGARHLHVGGIAGVGERHVVLPGRAGRHVLVGAEAAHHPHVGLHPVPLQPAAVEDPVVGPGLRVVGDRQGLFVAVEAVGVLHDELAGAQHPGSGARLIALLDLEVVEHQRQVAVGAHLAGDVRGQRLLVGHGQHQVCPAAVGQLEQLVDRVAPRAAP
jgi:hypothetical protein